jgi:tripartite-type tricarboxylate transporter receptor subunit TctC
MKATKLRTASAGALGIALVFSLAQSACQAADPYYQGKTITVLVGLGAGGGTDVGTRIFIRYMSKYIPGSPNMIVQNMTGAGGQTALNHLYTRAQPDGLTLLSGSWNAAGSLLSLPGVRSIPEKLEMVGGGGSTYLTIIRTDVPPGIKSPKDVVKAKSIFLGGTNPTVVLDMLGRMSFDVMGVKYRYVAGYRGQADLQVPLKANEIQAVTTGYQGYGMFYKNEVVTNGEAIAAWHHPPFDEAGNQGGFEPIAGVQSFLQVYQDAHGRRPSGPLWETYKWATTFAGASSQGMLAPPGTPKQALDDLRKAHLAARNDPEYMAEWQKRFGRQLRWLSNEEAQRSLRNYKNVSPEVIAHLRNYMQKASK